MLKQICEIRDFVFKLKARMRFGKLSRAPLRLLRLEVRDDFAECDWLARSPDEWDRGLPAGVSESNESEQALEDAMIVRDLLFEALPNLSAASLSVYRHVEGEAPELIIKGKVGKPEYVRYSVRSLVMRAKLCGLQFWLDNGRLTRLQLDEHEAGI